MDFDRIINRLKESLSKDNFYAQEYERTWYKDGILNCADAFLTCMRDEKIIPEEEIFKAIHKFGQL
jgi:hypothetical protein